MDSTIIQKKMMKAERLLENVDQEICVAISFLSNLRLQSKIEIKKLRDMSSHPLFIKEYIQANTVLLKYFSFLTEINCKFELLNALENGWRIQTENTGRIEINNSLTQISNLNLSDSPALALPSTDIINNSSNNAYETVTKNVLLNGCDESSISEISSKISTISEKCLTEIFVRPFELKVKEGDQLKVIMKYIKSPSEFYVHVLCNELKNMEELERNLRLLPLAYQNDNFKESSMKEMGSYALFYSITEETWCRAKINDWCLDQKDNYVNIFLLDYGESKCVNLNLLTPFREFFQKYPAYAVRCHLYGLCSEDRSYLFQSTDCVSNWDEEATEAMKFYFDDKSKLTIEIASEGNDNDYPYESLPVILREEGKDESINDFLVKFNYARKISNNEKLNEWNPMKEDFESFNNTYDLNLNDPATSIYGYAGKDYKRICLHFAKTGKCFKGESCRKKHITLDPLGYTRDEEEMFQHAFNTLPVPSIKDKLNVHITYIPKFAKFFCCMKNTVNTLDEEDLNSLTKNMNSEKNKLVMRKMTIPPSIGQLVLAQFTDDDCWYRAKVVDCISETNLYTVFFVDYGNMENLPISRIRSIEPKYLHLPFQAIKCTIYGIRKNPYVIGNIADEYACERLNESFVTIEVVSTIPGEQLSLLVNVYDNKGKNIADDLISKGYALVKKDFVEENGVESVPG